MKTHPSRSKNGFTLVELLVVIAIIAVLASAGFSVGARAIQKSKQVTCLATATSIESAVNSFFTEYGSMPKANLTSDTIIATCDKSTQFDVDFLNIMLGEETSTPAVNTKGIKFLTLREGKGNKDGVIYDTGSTGKVKGLYDPWGGPFFVMLDGDYDEKLEARPAAASAVTYLRNRRVAVWSNGADNLTGSTSSGKGEVIDDVKTWK